MVDELAEWLIENDFSEDLDHRGDSLSDQRFSREGCRILMPRRGCPWVTFQRVTSNDITWFQDFAADAPLSAVTAFIDSAVN